LGIYAYEDPTPHRIIIVQYGRASILNILAFQRTDSGELVVQGRRGYKLSGVTLHGSTSAWLHDIDARTIDHRGGRSSRKRQPRSGLGNRNDHAAVV